jgi:signal transduction histidine kinase
MELVQDSDLLFLQLRRPKGEIELSFPAAKGLGLPGPVMDKVEQGRPFSLQVQWRGQPTLVSLLPLRPGLTDIYARRHPGHGPGRSPGLLLLGLDITKHLALYQRYRRDALLQTGYLLVVALALWILTLAYLRRRQQGQRVQALENFQTALLDTMPEALLTLDKDGLIQGTNPAANRLFGDRGQQILGKTWPEALNLLSPTAKSLPRPIDKWQKLTLKDKDIEVISVPLDAENTPAKELMLIRDRTELNRLERDLEESRRLASIGKMAAGLAHEIRNPLSAIRGLAQFFATKFRPEDQATTYAQTMVHEADRLNRVVTDLLYLSRPRPPRLEELELTGLAQDLRRLLRFDLEQRQARLSLDLKTDYIQADAEGLRRCLLNLILNSLSALPQSGGEVVLGSKGDQDGTWLYLRDNGQGMDAETQTQALEPFFSTKDQGTGLGLALVQRIVREHGGRVEIKSWPKQGTEVTMFFPRQQPPGLTDRQGP